MPWVPAISVAAVLWTVAAPASGQPLLVSAAVSLSEALQECGAAFQRATGRRVTFNFAASNALARQIVHGAPADVFVSADAAQMDVVDRAGRLLAGTRRPIVSNALVIVAAGAGATPWSDPKRLTSPEVRRIAVGDPQAVPAGVYAKQWLARVGLWGAVKGKIVPAGSVRGALAAVNGGAIPVGIVYRTDARAAHGVSVVYEVSGDAAPRISYPAAVVRHAREEEGARLFVKFLAGDEAQRIFAAHGFGPPDR